nr:MAG TPA: hypothetical protein [Caudoviricetes sp.]
MRSIAFGYIRHVPKLENRLHLGTYSGSDCAVNIKIDSYYQEKRFNSVNELSFIYSVIFHLIIYGWIDK